ncbi:MAG: signal peptidase I [Dehalococcoidales bacterium]
MQKIISRFLMVVLSLTIAGLAFIYFTDGYNLYLVRSESMTPAILMGDMIITGPPDNQLGGEVKPGTVVTYEYNEELITHRVLSVDGNILVTKGDATEDPDPWTVTMSDVRGVYLFKIPYVGFMLNFIRSKLGWFLTIIIPGSLLVLWITKDILKEAFSEA